METIDGIRLVNLAIRLAVIGLCIAGWLRRPKSRLWVIPPVSWAVHGVVFYAVLLLGVALPPTFQSLWSSALGLHVGFLIVGAVWLVIWPARGWRT